jgi:hypothetical protein
MYPLEVVLQPDLMGILDCFGLNILEGFDSGVVPGECSDSGRGIKDSSDLGSV